MIHKVLLFEEQSGLRAHAAAAFVQEASRFESQMLIEKGNKKVNAKSIMGVLSLGVGPGDSLHLIVTGTDEEEAMAAIQTLVKNGFPGAE